MTAAAHPRAEAAANIASPLHYPLAALTGDLVGGAGGLLACAVCCAVPGVGGLFRLALLAGALLFAWFLVQLVRRARVQYAVDADGVRMLPSGPHIAWASLDHLRLRYFSVRRDRERGWMELELGARGQRIKVDSRLDGFNALVAEASRVAAARSLALDAATTTNIGAATAARTTLTP